MILGAHVRERERMRTPYCYTCVYATHKELIFNSLTLKKLILSKKRKKTGFRAIIKKYLEKALLNLIKGLNLSHYRNKFVCVFIMCKFSFCIIVSAEQLHEAFNDVRGGSMLSYKYYYIIIWLL